jgi:hypothetical protein
MAGLVTYEEFDFELSADPCFQFLMYSVVLDKWTLELDCLGLNTSSMTYSFFFLILQGMVNEGNFYHMADSEKHFEKNLPTSSLIYLPSTNIYRMCTLCQGSSMPS